MSSKVDLKGLSPHGLAEHSKMTHPLKEGFEVKKVETIFKYGQPYREVSYEKNGDVKWGKIPQAMVYTAGGILGAPFYCFEGTRQGYLDRTWNNLSEVVNDEDEPLLGERVGSLAAGVLLTALPPATFANFSKPFRQETWHTALYGKIEEKRLYALEDNEKAKKQKEDLERLKYKPLDGKSTPVRYDPTKRDTIASYVRALIKDGSPYVRQMDDGSYVVLENRREGRNSFLLIPQGDFEKATSILYWSEPSGDKITDPAAQWRAINTLLVGRQEIEKGLDDKADEIAKKRSEGKNLSDKEIDKLRDAIRKEYARKPIRVSPKSHTWRLGSDDPNNPDKNHSINGSFGDKTGKHIDVIHNKNMMEHKGKLGGEQPFKKRPQPDSHEVDID